VQVLSAAAAAATSVHDAGLNVPVPPVTLKLTDPVGCAAVTAALLMSKPVSCTVTVQALVVCPTVFVVSGQFSVVVVAWPALTVTPPVSVSRLK
jgi:hypothetical protein